MDELEQRVRRGLQHPSRSVDATEILADVHRGVRNRQQRRLAVGAAGVLAVFTASGLLTGTTTGPDRSADVATGPTTSVSASARATSGTATPAQGSRSGPLGFDATAGGPVWVLELATCGHQPCSVLTRTDGSGPGVDVHTFALGADTRGAADLPPAETVTASVDGRDLWVAGQSLWSSHDGGTTWTEQALAVGEVPQRITVQVVGDDVFALQSHPSRLWRSSLARDDWTEVALPAQAAAVDQLTSAGSRLVVTAEPAHGPRSVLLSDDGGDTWRSVDPPCQGEASDFGSVDGVLTAVCGAGTISSGPESLVWRSDDGESWQVLARIEVTSYLDLVVPIDRSTVLAVTGEGGLLVTEQGQQQVELPMGKDDRSLGGEFSDAEHGWLLVTSPARLLATEDGGRTWAPVG